ncbi:hypothetical protein HY745_04660, partial [Candidatus Desantisbacteria bacterium]|nr:hypothetical protein [Candidatus Desantisbacteria bacterium]
IKKIKFNCKYEFQAWKSWENKPVVIMIHGHGLSKNSWINPYEEKYQNCNLKFKGLLTDYRHNPTEKDAGIHDGPPQSAFLQFGFSKPLEYLELPPKSLWDFLKENGYNLATWSQKNPDNNIEEAIDELTSYVIPTVKKLFKTNSVVLAGHGRGGLIARKYAELYYDKRKDVSGIIMMGTPHQGTNLSRFNKELSVLFSSLCIFIDEEAPLSSLLSTVLNGVPDQKNININVLDEAIEKQALMIKNIKIFFSQMQTFFASCALEQMSSTSDFISSLKEEKKHGIYYSSICGTENTFTKMYLWFYKSTSFISHKSNKQYQWIIQPREITKILDIVEKLLPRILIPRELTKNKGDGLVSIESARLPFSDETHSFHLNHLDLLVNYSVKEKIIKVLEKITQRNLNSKDD